MTNISPAATMLHDWLAGNNLTRLRFSYLLGTDPSVLATWLRGARRPSLDFAVAIEKVTGIPASAWADEVLVTAAITRCSARP